MTAAFDEGCNDAESPWLLNWLGYAMNPIEQSWAALQKALSAAQNNSYCAWCNSFGPMCKCCLLTFVKGLKTFQKYTWKIFNWNPKCWILCLILFSAAAAVVCLRLCESKSVVDQSWIALWENPPDFTIRLLNQKFYGWTTYKYTKEHSYYSRVLLRTGPADNVSIIYEF